ncbi:hypothetical protein P1T94_22590, partial [Escherichia coli]|nr:hypothetical protein [Escherichia coli]
MLIIIMTRDRYLEYGLMRILSGYQVTTGRELFNAGKQRQSLPEDSYVIRKRTARAVLTGMCYSAGSAMRHGSSS